MLIDGSFRSDPDPKRKRPSDEMLVNDAKHGNELALVELWGRYGGMLRSKVWRITGNWEDTDDVIQETYLKSFIHLPQFDGRSKFSTWMMRIAINSALMLLRKRRRKREVVVETGDQTDRSFDFPAKHEDIESHYVCAERRHLLQSAVRELRPSLRHIFVLKYEHDLSVGEVAEMTRLSVPTVKTRLFRARAHLRDSLSSPTKGAG